MKKIVFLMFSVLLAGGCAVSNTQNKPHWRGIDYSVYENPVIRDSDDYTANSLPNPSVFDNDTRSASAQYGHRRFLS